MLTGVLTGATQPKSLSATLRTRGLPMGATEGSRARGGVHQLHMPQRMSEWHTGLGIGAVEGKQLGDSEIPSQEARRVWVRQGAVRVRRRRREQGWVRDTLGNVEADGRG